jgi:hypothetical protein
MHDVNLQLQQTLCNSVLENGDSVITAQMA